jgi:hypothetical protein
MYDNKIEIILAKDTEDWTLEEIEIIINYIEDNWRECM